MPDKTKKSSKFQGTSTRGDFNEAVKNATAAALQGLPAELVIWKLLEVSGHAGGFTGAKDITVTIEAREK